MQMKEMDSRFLRPIIEQEILFASEAAAYLGITPQRLNQLVHTGKVKPVRTSPSGNLYLRSDMEERRKRMHGNQIAYISALFEKNEATTVYEAMNYFTIQSIFNGSDKKATAEFERLAEKFQLTEELTNNLRLIADDLGVELEVMEKAYTAVVGGFQQLGADDYIVKKGQNHYPNKLSEISDAPLFLFMRGNPELLTKRLVTVVGGRKTTENGEAMAYELSKELGQEGYVIVSGLSKGIDSVVQQATVNHQLPTVAVLGTPITHFHPREHQVLQGQLEDHGLVISQFPPSVKVQRWHFPMRYALMSGISEATVMIESTDKSEVLEQADYACKYRRPLLLPQVALDDRKLQWPNRYIDYGKMYAYRKPTDVLKRMEMLTTEDGTSARYAQQTIG
ncbi:Rossmann fold nucleotide-binding protein Smf [Geomicrobium sp. JCM 19055]|nr:Rossmann fold nucleotide-binding protein Smf [Geomicrobium sp. JCM 19055]